MKIVIIIIIGIFYLIIRIKLEHNNFIGIIFLKTLTVQHSNFIKTMIFNFFSSLKENNTRQFGRRAVLRVSVHR